jgi:predicted enzyme related to lactoylglutathione lyase
VGEIVKFGGILIGSDNPQRLVDFYKRVLGEPGWDEAPYTGWLVGTGTLMVGPHDEVHGANREPGRVIWNFETEDVKAEFERIRAAGASVVREPYNPMGEDATQEFLLATFADPDGNYFQLGSPMEM